MTDQLTHKKTSPLLRLLHAGLLARLLGMACMATTCCHAAHTPPVSPEATISAHSLPASPRVSLASCPSMVNNNSIRIEEDPFPTLLAPDILEEEMPPSLPLAPQPSNTVYLRYDESLRRPLRLSLQGGSSRSSDSNEDLTDTAARDRQQPIACLPVTHSLPSLFPVSTLPEGAQLKASHSVPMPSGSTDLGSEWSVPTVHSLSFLVHNGRVIRLTDSVGPGGLSLKGKTSSSPCPVAEAQQDQEAKDQCQENAELNKSKEPPPVDVLVSCVGSPKEGPGQSATRRLYQLGIVKENPGKPVLKERAHQAGCSCFLL